MAPGVCGVCVGCGEARLPRPQHTIVPPGRGSAALPPLGRRGGAHEGVPPPLPTNDVHSGQAGWQVACCDSPPLRPVPSQLLPAGRPQKRLAKEALAQLPSKGTPLVHGGDENHSGAVCLCTGGQRPCRAQRVSPPVHGPQSASQHQSTVRVRHEVHLARAHVRLVALQGLSQVFHLLLKGRRLGVVRPGHRQHAVLGQGVLQGQPLVCLGPEPPDQHDSRLTQ